MNWPGFDSNENFLGAKMFAHCLLPRIFLSSDFRSRLKGGVCFA
jgi:hypothetical protein